MPNNFAKVDFQVSLFRGKAKLITLVLCTSAFLFRKGCASLNSRYALALIPKVGNITDFV